MEFDFLGLALSSEVSQVLKEKFHYSIAFTVEPICDRILENLPCWHKTRFRAKQLNFSDSFSTPIFIAHFDKANIKLCCCKV